MASNRLSTKARFELMKELELLMMGPRKGTITTLEFAKEMSRELGTDVNSRNIEACCESFGVRLSDVFKSGSTGRSIYADIYKLEQRIAVLEEKLAGL